MKPADFPLGSQQSRVAARAALVERERTIGRCELILGSRPEECPMPRASEWQENAKGGKARIISIPEGMTLEQGLSALGGYSERQLAKADEFCPEPLSLGTMLMLRR